MDYRNRILGLEYVHSRDLDNHPGNWRAMWYNTGVANQIDSHRDALTSGGFGTRNGEFLMQPHDTPDRPSRLYNVSGIYALRNLVNGKVYVGSAVSLGERRKTHFGKLRRQQHPNRHLQSAYNRYGRDAFAFVVLELVPNKSVLTAREQHWMDTLQACSPDHGYNLRPRAESSLGKKYTPEQRARRSEILKGNQNALGTKQTQATIDKRRLKMMGRHWKMSEERKQLPEYQAWRKRHSELMRGRKHDWHTSIAPEVRAKISVSVKRARAANLKVYEGFVDPTGNAVGPIRGLDDFCREYGLERRNMQAVYEGKRKSHKGWTVSR